jgi:hypothetical protein
MVTSIYRTLYVWRVPVLNTYVYKQNTLTQITQKLTRKDHTTMFEESIFWDITPSSPLKVNWRFGGTCCFQLYVRRIWQAKILSCHYYLIYVSFLLCLFFNPKFRGNFFLPNVGLLSQIVEIFIITAVKTSNPTQHSPLFLWNPVARLQ